MKFEQSLFFSFIFLLALSHQFSLTESINVEDRCIECYDCPSDEEEAESIFPPFNLTLESFDSDLMAQFIEDLPEDEIFVDEQEEDEELELSDALEVSI